MPKLAAPHEATWRGLALAAGETIDVPDEDVPELAAHGFLAFEADTGDRLEAPAHVASLSRKELLRHLRGRGAGNLFVKSTEALRALAAARPLGHATAIGNSEPDHDDDG